MKLLLAFILFPYVLFAPSLDAPNDQELGTLFQSSIEAHEKEDFYEAKVLLDKWIEKAKMSSIDSPEVHHNLAATLAAQSDLLAAAKELIETTKLLIWPIDRIKELGHLREVQRQLGVQNSPLEKLSSVLLLGLSREFLYFLILITLWSFLGFYYIRFTRRRSYKWLPVVGLCALLILGGSRLQKRLFGNLAVLQAGEDVPVYSSSDMKEEIISLPPGTLVRIRRSLDSTHQILEPIYGWVKSETCLMTDLPASVRF